MPAPHRDSTDATPSGPAAPQTLADRVAAWHASVTAILSIGRTLTPQLLDTATACPGWTVQDQIAHVAGLESLLAGDPPLDVAVPDYPWLRHPIGRMIEQSVEARRGRSSTEVLDELAALLPRRLAALEQATDDTPMLGIMGTEAPAAQVMRMRLTDVWCHEQDIREAVGRPGGLDTSGAAAFVALLGESLPRIVAKETQVPVGHTVVLESTQEVPARFAVRVDHTAAGNRCGSTVEVPERGADLTTWITLSTRDLTRRGAGRTTEAQTSYDVTGDVALAREVVEALAVTP